MKILFVILGVVVAIICLIILILLLPLTLELKYNEELILNGKYLGITVFGDEKEEKKRKKKSNASNGKDTQKYSTIKETYKQKGLVGTVKYYGIVIKSFLKKFSWLVKRFKFRKLDIDLTIATQDAATTAITYGEVCGAMYPILSFLHSNINLKSKKININADFEKTNSEIKASVLVKASLFLWIIALIGWLYEVSEIQRKERENNERKQS